MDLKDLTVTKVAEHSYYLENEVAKPLGLRPEPMYVDNKTMLKEADDLSRNGIIQGLLDLGYLDERDSDGVVNPFSIAELDMALTKWRKDTRECPTDYCIRSSEDSFYLSSEEVDLFDPLPLLIIQTGFDADLILKEMPIPEELPTLQSRILQFRLKMLNRYEEKVGLEYSLASQITFRNLRKHVEDKPDENDLTILNRLGNGFELSDLFCRCYRGQIFVTKYDSEAGAVNGEKRLAEFYHLNRKGRYTSRAKLRKHSRKIRTRAAKKSTVLEYNPKHKRRSNLNEDFKKDVNSLGLELLQLRLWQHGYYKGTLDANWGKLSRNALEDFLKTFKEEFGLKKREFIAEVEGGQVLNLVYILEDLMQIADGTASLIKKEDLDKIADGIFQVRDDDEDEEEDKEEDTWNRFKQQAEYVRHQEADALWIREVKTFRNGESKKSKRRRRLNLNFFGIKAAITGWFRRIKKKVRAVTDWIKEVALQIRDAIKSGLASIHTFFRFALNKIRRVIRVVKAAVQRFYYWITGKPFGTGESDSRHFVMTQWSMDFDTVSVTSRGCPKPLLENHNNRICFLHASFHFAIKLALIVLGIIAKAATGNWLRLAWTIYREVRQWKPWTEDNPYFDYVEGDYVT